jgi:methyl-accepting chemotaxis protein
MNAAMAWISAALIFLITAAAFACLCEKNLIRTHKDAAQKLKLFQINRILIKGFLLFYIPLTIMMVLFCVMDIFVFSKYPTRLLFTTIITTIAFVLERVIESTQLAGSFSTSSESIITNKAVFAYIDLYHEVERINRDLIQQLADSQSGLLSQFEQTQKKINYISEHIDGYVQWQTAECQKLLEERNKLEQFFSDLGLRTEQLCGVFVEYEKKLNNSSKALLYCEKGAVLIEDIQESFVSRYQQTSNEFIRRLDDTENQLRKVVEQYSRFKDHMGPYNEKVAVYGSRIESTIQSLQKSSDSKQAVLENTSNEIIKALGGQNDIMEKTLNDVDQFLRKNIFVLSKILETYRTNAATPRKLKKILRSWQSLSPAEGKKA